MVLVDDDGTTNLVDDDGTTFLIEEGGVGPDEGGALAFVAPAPLLFRTRVEARPRFIPQFVLLPLVVPPGTFFTGVGVIFQLPPPRGQAV